jgi:23S rRNA (pseudouridine1915-N3)-methyltransferase
MKILLASIAAREPSGHFAAIAQEYIERLGGYVPVESKTYRSEQAFLEMTARSRSRTPPVVIFLDSRGKSLSSEDLSAWIGKERDSGAQNMVFAIGPADGWSVTARASANLLLSFGAMTLPHELARVVLAEQVYRAFTILAGHPYHGGH